MKRSLLPAALVLLSACEPRGYQPDPDRVARTVTSPAGDVGAAVEGATGFTWALYDELAPEGEGNLFFSPFSAVSALGMTAAGAEGETEAQLLAALGTEIPEADWHAALGALTRDLSGDQHRAYTLHVANKLFGQEGYPWEQPFLDVCETDYGAPLQPWDFMTDPEGGRAAVNDWVAENTADRIQDLLPAGSVDTDTRLILANAIYFLADWATAFDPEDTIDRAFTKLDGSTVTVPVMHLDTEELEEHAFELGAVDGARLLRLPYEEHELSMILVVPDATDGLPALEAGLDAETWAAWTASLSPAGDVSIALPKLEIRTEVDLVAPLQALGIVDAFDGTLADFTGMSSTLPEGPLYVTGVFHQAFVKVDEAGTEAAAATGVVVGIESAAPDELAATHPFLFVIQDDLTGAILFVGRVTDPS